MYIKRIELKNFQAIKEFTSDFDGNVYLVTGENELGKSTLLKSIMVLLTGSRDEVLRNGEDKGYAKIIVGDDGKEYEVKLSMTKANPRGTITITSKDTGLRSDRITALQDIFGYQDFDANEFVAWSETAEGRRKQVQIVKSLLSEETQKAIADIDAQVSQIKEQRKTDNAELKMYTGVFAKIQQEVTPADIQEYAEEIDMEVLMQQQAQAVKLDEKAKSVRQLLEEREKTIADTPALIEDYQQQIKDAELTAEQEKANAKSELDKAIEVLKNRYNEKINNIDNEKAKTIADYRALIDDVKAKEADAINRRNNCNKWLQDYENNKPQDVTELIANAKHHNEMHRKVADYTKAENDKNAAAAKVAGHEKKLKELADKRENYINKSEIPINGLTFTEDGLELNGIPFVSGRVSDSQIMEVAAKLIIAKNPKVKVFRIARGESLGKKKLEALVKFAKDNGFQGFVEQVVREQDELRVEKYEEAHD